MSTFISSSLLYIIHIMPNSLFSTSFGSHSRSRIIKASIWRLANDWSCLNWSGTLLIISIVCTSSLHLITAYFNNILWPISRITVPNDHGPLFNLLAIFVDFCRCSRRWKNWSKLSTLGEADWCNPMWHFLGVQYSSRAPSNEAISVNVS